MKPPALPDLPNEPSEEEKPTPEDRPYRPPFQPQSRSEVHRQIFLAMMEFNERNNH